MSQTASTKSGDEFVRSLYKSLSSCAEHHEDDVIERIHIGTPIEDAIVMAAKKNRVVVVTGNPGDGKTHLIRKMGSEFPKKITVNKDANEVDDEDLTRSIDDAFTNKKPMILAINEGILLDICEKAKKRNLWPQAIIDAILRPYVYGDESAVEHERITVLDLNLRNNLSQPIVEQALARIISIADGSASSPLYNNLQRLKDYVVRERIIRLLDAVAASGFHATMRDLLAFLAYLICGGEEESNGRHPKPYYVNAFNGGIGPLFDRLREFDPLLMPHPFLDYKIFMGEDEPGEWNYVPPDEMVKRGDMALFRERKRRAYFEHKEGDKILRQERGEVDRYFKKLRETDRSPENVAVGLLNRFFDSKDTQNDNLVIWVGHQFSAKPARYVASRQIINSSEFEVKIPSLPAHLKETFTGHYPDHVILKHKQMPIGNGLVIDRRFLEMLLAGDRVSGLGSRNLEAYTKVAAFYDRLAKVCTNQQNIVQIMRLDNLNKVKIGVSVATREYFIPGA
jgi:hypothetical protein